MSMTSKQRMLTALDRGIPDRLPVTTHHLMPYFLDKYMGGISKQGFFDHFGMDAIVWTVPHRPDLDQGEYYDPSQGEPGFLESRRIANNDWRIEFEDIPHPRYATTRYRIITPKGELTTVLQSNDHTTWVTEHLIKEKTDIDLIGEFVTAPKCDVEAVNATANAFGERGLVRGHICCFDLFGQPGTWQDACCLVGTQKMIMETFDDSVWVHELLKILHARKTIFIQSLQGAQYDILELGGGDASTTVISPDIFENFVAPYDSELIKTAHEAGQRIAYHTCGGMMPILETVAAMKPSAMETLTPPEMGGDVRLAELKARVGDKVCLIGSFDQYHYFEECSEQATRAAVRRNFEAAGEDGGFIISPSDHFFDADPKLIAAFADEARRCTYEI